MRCQATVRLSDDRQVVLGHGDHIGRLWNSTLVLDDPRISEAHAVVSLRGHELKLLALRGRFAVDGKPLAEIALRAGQRIELAADLYLDVLDVSLPDTLMGLATDGMPLRVVPGTCALVHEPSPGLAPASNSRALAHVWAVPEGWRIRVVGQATRPLVAGESFQVAGRLWHSQHVDLFPEGLATTPDRSLAEPLHIVARYDTVHLHRPDRPAVVLVGLSARLITELVTFRTPVPWAVLCAELWSDGGSRKQLDMALVRLRQKLREFRVRTDLVRLDGVGVVELFLGPHDRADDQT